MEAQRSTNFNEFYRSIGEHSINIRAKECFDKVLYHVNSQILKCKMTNVITMAVKGRHQEFFFIVKVLVITWCSEISDCVLSPQAYLH
jgi:hypothetical protein